MATVTALRRAGPGRVALDVDGRPWRTVPDAVVVRCGLHAGLELDRPRLRLLRAELGRAEALAAAGRALARTSLSRQRVSERLRRRGTRPSAEREALEALEATGVVNDPRVAQARAAALADRGWGDLAIVARLESEGFDESDALAAVAALTPETERAAAWAGRLGAPRRKAWSTLARRGFAAEAIDEAVGSLDVDGPPG